VKSDEARAGELASKTKLNEKKVADAVAFDEDLSWAMKNAGRFTRAMQARAGGNPFEQDEEVNGEMNGRMFRIGKVKPEAVQFLSNILSQDSASRGNIDQSALYLDANKAQATSADNKTKRDIAASGLHNIPPGNTAVRTGTAGPAPAAAMGIPQSPKSKQEVVELQRLTAKLVLDGKQPDKIRAAIANFMQARRFTAGSPQPAAAQQPPPAQPEQPPAPALQQGQIGALTDAQALEYLKRAAGDKNKARAMAQADGFSF